MKWSPLTHSAYQPEPESFADGFDWQLSKQDREQAERARAHLDQHRRRLNDMDTRRDAPRGRRQ